MWLPLGNQQPQGRTPVLKPSSNSSLAIASITGSATSPSCCTFLQCWKFGISRSKGCKLTSYQSLRSKKKSAALPQPHSNQPASIWERLESNHSQSLMAGNFAALCPTDPKFLSLKDLNLLKKYPKNQKASSILRWILPYLNDLIYTVLSKCL